MALGGTYNTGLVGVTNASAAVPGVGVLWSDVMEGDWLQVGAAIGVIDSVAGTFDSIALKDGWAGVSDSAVTITSASPAVVSLTAHGKSAGDPVSFFTTGSLWTGLVAGTTYFVIAAGLTSGAFEVSATVGGAAINTSGSQSGVHSIAQPYRILKMSWLRYDPSLTQAKLRQFINVIETASLFGVPFAWDTGTSDADPGAGNIRANNASLASATVLYISKTSRAGANVAAFLAALDDSSSTSNKGNLILGAQPEGTQAMFKVGAVTDATNYIKLAISNPSGVTLFLSGDLINFQFTQIGDLGSPLAGTNTWTGVNTFSNTTDSTTIATGALIVAGGVGIAKQLFVGGNAATLGAAGTSAFYLNLMGGTSGTGAGSSIRFTNNVTWSLGNQSPIYGGTYSDNFVLTSSALGSVFLFSPTTGALTLYSTTASTTTSTGALVVAGGAGIAGALNVGGLATISTLKVLGSSAITLDASTQTLLTATNGGSVRVGWNNFILVVNTGSQGQALYVGNSATTYLLVSASTSEFVSSTTTPAGGHSSVADSGVDGYHIYNNTGATATYRAITFTF